MIIKDESARKHITDILASDPHAELRERISQKWNGQYAVKICTFCGKYTQNQSGNVATCPIVDICSDCLDTPRCSPPECLKMSEDKQTGGITMYKFSMLIFQLVVDVSCLSVLVAICLWQYGQSDFTDHRSCVILGLLIAVTLIVGVSCGVKWGMGVYRKELEDAERKEKGKQK